MNGVSQQGDVAGRSGIDLRRGAQSQDEGLFWLALLYEDARAVPATILSGVWLSSSAPGRANAPLNR
jgi:hypothetical protein